jgi:predicted outer membrane repeat protein
MSKAKTHTHKRTKRIFSILLTLAMIATAIPNMAFADTIIVDDDVELNNQFGHHFRDYVTYYKDGGSTVKQTTTKGAMEAAGSGSPVIPERDGYTSIGYTHSYTSTYSQAADGVFRLDACVNFEYTGTYNDIMVASYVKDGIVTQFSGTAETEDSVALDNIYLDQENGDDNNSGYSADSPVKTLEKAKSLIKIKCGNLKTVDGYGDHERTAYFCPKIYLMSTYTIGSDSSDVQTIEDLTLDGYGRTRFARYQGSDDEHTGAFTDVMFKIQGSETSNADNIANKYGEDSYQIKTDENGEKLTGVPEPITSDADYNTKIEMYNMIIDGGIYNSNGTFYESTKTAPAIIVDGAELTLSYGAMVINNNAKVSYDSSLNYAAGGIHVKKASSLVMDGGAVRNCSCESISSYTGAGGIYVDGVVVNMQTPTNPNYKTSHNYSSGASFIMNDGVISHNTGDIAALYLRAGGYYEIDGGYISNNLSTGADKSMYNYCGSFIGTNNRTNAGNIICIPYEGWFGNFGDYDSGAVEMALTTPLYLNGGNIMDNTAETIISVPVLYATGANISYNERYNPELTNMSSYKNTSSYICEPSAAVIRTMYLGVSGDEEKTFEVTHNEKFQSTASVVGTVKMTKGKFADNTAYVAVGSNPLASAITVMHNNRKSQYNSGFPYSIDTKIYTDIENVEFSNNTCDFSKNIAPYGGSAVFIYSGEGLGSDDVFEAANIKNCVFSGNSMPKTFDYSSSSSMLNVSNISGAAISGRYYGSFSDCDANKTLNVTGTTFENNYSAGGGGAIGAYFNKKIYMNFTDCEFNGNTAAYPIAGTSGNYAGGGGAISLKYMNTYHAGKLTIRGCTFDKNTASTRGGAIATTGMILDIDKSDNNKTVFKNNTATSTELISGQDKEYIGGGAIHEAFSDGTTISNTEFYNNSAVNGGAYDSYNSQDASSTTKFDNCEFYDNGTYQAKNDSRTTSLAQLDLNYLPGDNNVTQRVGVGGAIYFSPLGNHSVLIENTNIHDNYAYTAGGGMYLASAKSFDIKDSNIKNNEARFVGGGVAYVPQGNVLSIDNSKIDSNSAAFGAGIGTFGGTINLNNGTEVTNNSILKNAYEKDVINTNISSNYTAGRSGGGLGLISTTLNVGTDNGKQVLISGNRADNGGGVYTLGSLTVNKAKITGNQARGDGAGIYAAKLSTYTGSVTLNENAEISNNTAVNANGGGLYLSSGASGTLNGGKISDNVADIYGAGIYTNGGNLTVNSGQIIGNETRLNTNIDYAGTAIYKGPNGNVTITPSEALNIFGDIRTVNTSSTATYYQLTEKLADDQPTIYVSAPEDSSRAEGNTVSAVLSSDGKYIVAQCSSEEIASDALDKFAYVGNKDYKIVIDADDKTQLILEENKTPTRSITVTHRWDDEENQDGLRPSNSKVVATLLANSEPVTVDADNNEVKSAELTGESATATWKNLPKYDSSNNIIQYSINMEYVNDSDEADSDYIPEGYVRTISSLTDGYLFNLKSSHTPEKIDITANKIWNDDLKSYETRSQTADDVNIVLTADGEAVTPDSVDTTSNARRWVYVWKDLPAYKDGALIDYEIEEKGDIENYTKSAPTKTTDSEGDVTYTIINTLNGWSKEKIGEVEINVPYPTDGDTLSSVAPTIGSGSYKIKSYKWLRRGSAVADDTKYESGVEYGLQVTLEPKDSTKMEFWPDVKTTVNVADNAPVTKSASISTDVDSITLEWTFRGKPSAVDTMSLFSTDVDALRKVDCTINPPSQDRLPSYSAPTANGEHYTVGTAKWYNNNTSTELAADDRFTTGVPYSVQANLKSDTGYSFDFGETNINVNGNVRTNKAILQANSTSDIAWYFDAIEAETHNITLDTENGSITLNKMDDIAAGETVSVTKYTPDLGYTKDGAELVVTRSDEDEQLTVTGDSFTMPGADVTVKFVFNKIPAQIGDVTVESKSVEYGYIEGNILSAVVAGKDTETYNYTYQWYSTPYEGTTNGSAITGATEETYTVPTGKNAGTYYYYCVVTATRKDNGETASNAGGATFTVTTKGIENVAATIIDPVPGQVIKDNPDSIIRSGSKYIQDGDIIWKKGDTVLEEEDEFEFNTEYTAELTLIPISDNYSFDDPVTGKINDQNEVEKELNEDGTVTLVYTITTAEKPEPGVPYAVITNPEIVTYEYNSASLTAVVKNCDFDKYTYTYQWYAKNSNSDEADEKLENESGAVTEDEQQLTYTLPTDKEVGVEKYYVAITGTAKAESDKDVNGTSNNGAFVVQPKEITTVTLTDINAPKYGETPDSDATIADTEKYIQSGDIAWYNGENKISAFDYNTKYTAKINLTPKANYIFADTVTATVNGETATVEIKENGNEAIVTYNGFSNTEVTPEVSPSPSTEATVEPTTEPTSTPNVTETTEPTSSPDATLEPTTSPSPSPTATTKVSRGGGGSGSVKTKATATPTVEPTTEPTTEPTSTPTDGSGNNGSGSNGSGSGKGGHSTPELNKQDHFAYMAGYPDNLFMPDNSISRAEVTVMFSRLLTQKMDSDSDYTVSFPDVDADAWYKSQVGFMEQYGIIEGYEDGTFRPENPITRAEFAVIASKFDKLSDTEENVFSDVDDDYWATPYILLAHSNGWINGYEDGTFRPLNSITRAEVVSIVNRMLERSCDSEFVTENAENIVNYSDISDQHWAYLDILEASNAHLYEKNPDEVWTELIDKE